MAYALLVERITATVLVDRQIAALAGAPELPDVTAALAALDLALVAESRREDPEREVLREALGLSRAG